MTWPLLYILLSRVLSPNVSNDVQTGEIHKFTNKTSCDIRKNELFPAWYPITLIVSHVDINVFKNGTPPIRYHFVNIVGLIVDSLK